MNAKRSIPIFLFAAAALAAPPARPQTADVDADSSLARQILAIVNRPEYKNANFGVEVYSIDDNEVLYALNAEKFFTPGSTTKLLTEGVGLELLGADYRFQNGMGPVQISPDGIVLGAPGAFACSPAGAMPRRCKIETTIAFEKNTRGCGLMLRVSGDLESAYYIRLEPLRNRLVFDTWPRPGDLPFDVGVERPLSLSAITSVDLKVFVDDTVCVVYAGDRVALNARLYDLKQGNWGVFVTDGSAKFHNSRISTP